MTWVVGTTAEVAAEGVDEAVVEIHGFGGAD